MRNWNQQDLRKHMHVYSSDNSDLGHIAEVYEDSFAVHHGLILTKDRYFPYTTVAVVEGDQVRLTMTKDEAQAIEWEKRPDYENHPGDPTQIFYDRGHGVRDPFDETNPDKA